jgi:hypothetical protein
MASSRHHYLNGRHTGTTDPYSDEEDASDLPVLYDLTTLNSSSSSEKKYENGKRAIFCYSDDSSSDSDNASSNSDDASSDCYEYVDIPGKKAAVPKVGKQRKSFDRAAPVPFTTTGSAAVELTKVKKGYAKLVKQHDTLLDAYNNASSDAQDLTASYASTKKMLSRSRKKAKSSQRSLDAQSKALKAAQKKLLTTNSKLATAISTIDGYKNNNKNSSMQHRLAMQEVAERGKTEREQMKIDRINTQGEVNMARINARSEMNQQAILSKTAAKLQEATDKSNRKTERVRLMLCSNPMRGGFLVRVGSFGFFCLLAISLDSSETHRLVSLSTAELDAPRDAPRTAAVL